MERQPAEKEIKGHDLNLHIIARGKELIDALEGGRPSVFEKGRWVGRLMEWSLRHDDFRTRMLRFVDVFPALSTSSSLVEHLREYFEDGGG